MTENEKKVKNTQSTISSIGITESNLTGRGGLAFFVKYIKKIKVLDIIVKAFDGLRKSRKGTALKKITSQFIFNTVDGTKQTMTRFDELKNGRGYLSTIETPAKDAVSSHTMKRFFKAITAVMLMKLQKILLRLFVWRLKIKKPKEIIIGADTMVLNNDDAKQREGVTPSYKSFMGFHVLFFYWGRFIINMAFHKGKEHHNTNNDFFDAVRDIVKIIRKKYDANVPIIFVTDAGFYDQKFFKLVDKLKSYFVCGGRLMDNVKLKIMANTPSKLWGKFSRNDRYYKCMDFMDQRDAWSEEYRALYYKQIDDENGQMHLDFDRPETLIYTNLMNSEKLEKEGLSKYLDREEIVSLYQLRARDEITNRVLKEFVDETLPFKKMMPNTGYYFLSIIAYNLMAAFQEDAISDVVSPMAYPNTLRRIFFDIAGKIVRTNHQVFLKFERSVYTRLKLPDVWQKVKLVSVFH